MADVESPDRIAAIRDKFSPIPVICSEILGTFWPARHIRAVEDCKVAADPTNVFRAERHQTKQCIQISRDFINDDSDDYRVRLLRTDDLQSPFARLPLH